MGVKHFKIHRDLQPWRNQIPTSIVLIKKKTKVYKFHNSMPTTRYMKILMGLLDIDYVEMEDTFASWKAKSMIKSKVPSSVVLF